MSQTSQTSAPALTIHAPVIFEQDGSLYTNSLSVAICFKKRHDIVLRDIRALIESCPAEFGLHNFVESSYLNSQGKEHPLYNLTYDGLILLVMGYTGATALEIKLRYIAEFNRMRAILERKKIEALTPASISPSQQAELKTLADAKLSCYPPEMQRKVRAELWSRFNRRFCIGKYSQLSPDQMDEAKEYIIDMEMRSAPAPDAPIQIDGSLSAREMRNLLSFTIGVGNGWKKAFESLLDKLRLAK